MGPPKTTSASWNDLPEPLAVRILRLAFAHSGMALLQWLRLSLVCRDWREMMMRNAVDLELLEPATVEQRAWLRTTRVPLRSISFMPPFDTKALGPPVVPDLAAVMLGITPDTLAASTRTLEEAHHVFVGRVPRHVTTLARFTALRRLSLHGADTLEPDEAAEMLRSLPKSLEALHVAVQDPIQGHAFACLSRLQELHIVASAYEGGDTYDGVVSVDLWGLPAGLQVLEVWVPDTDALLNVLAAPGPPAALLRMDARAIELHAAAESAGGAGGRYDVRLLELTADALSFEGLVPDMEEHDLATTAGLQACLGQHLVDWIARCGAAAVRLGVHEDCNAGCFFDLHVYEAATPGGSPLERQAAYRFGSRDLLDAVQSPCRRRGLRCTDVDGTGQVLLFERL